jgi:hypothetical protein
VSAFFNPGILLAQAVRGNVGGAGDFFALLAAELVGYSVGAVVLWVFYLPHLNSAVQLPAADEVDRLLLDPSMLRQAGRRRQRASAVACRCRLRCRPQAPTHQYMPRLRYPPCSPTPALPCLSALLQ